jgi:predicted metalloprotease with PDZ domain
MNNTMINHQETTANTQPSLVYEVAMSQPQSHLFEVTLHINNWQQSSLTLKMPVWTPGSYLVREYSRNLQNFQAKNKLNNDQLIANKVNKNTWLIDTKNTEFIVITYQVFANELTVRTNHLDGTHGYFNGSALFLYIPGLENLPFKIKIISPKSDWKVSTSLPQVEGEENTFIADNLDILVDNPFEIGTQKIYDFEVLGKNHQWIIWGEGNINIHEVIEDTKKIITTEAEIFGGLPYSEYKFLLHLSASGFGGLEHKNCCSLNYPRLGFKNREKYYRFMQLTAHEFFHLWNVKRIRPQALEKFDYEQENYTTSLWFSEGTTSYYDLLIPLRANIYSRKTFFELLSKDITKYLSIPGRFVQPLRESSFDAWIKLYRRDASSDNSQISYYLKGELVSLLLDLLIRKNHHNQKSLDDVMLKMWHKFGKDEIGFTENDLKQVFEEVAKTDLTDFFSRYLDTTEELPFNEYLEPFGLQLKGVKDHNSFPYLGITVQSDRGKELINLVSANSPAAVAGIDPGDELLAIDGIRVTAETLNERLKDYHQGDTIQVSVFHEEQLKTVAVKLAPPQPTRYELSLIKNPSPQQKELFEGWFS